MTTPRYNLCGIHGADLHVWCGACVRAAEADGLTVAKPGIGSPAVQAEFPPPDEVEVRHLAAQSGKPDRLDGKTDSVCPICYKSASWCTCPDPVCVGGQAQAIKDSGIRVEHSTGAVRDSAAGRGRPDLISPVFLERLAVHLERGAAKYAERNWERGLPICRMFASLMRHTWLAFQGYKDEDHLAAMACNVMFILHTLEMIDRKRLPASLDDRPDYSRKDS